MSVDGWWLRCQLELLSILLVITLACSIGGSGWWHRCQLELLSILLVITLACSIGGNLTMTTSVNDAH